MRCPASTHGRVWGRVDAGTDAAAGRRRGAPEAGRPPLGRLLPNAGRVSGMAASGQAPALTT